MALGPDSECFPSRRSIGITCRRPYKFASLFSDTLNMRPRFSIDGITHNRPAHSSPPSKLRLCSFSVFIFGSRVLNNLFREFGSRFIFTPYYGSPALIVHVLEVLALRAGSKVMRIAAGLAGNARMQNIQANRNVGFVVDNPRNDMPAKGVLFPKQSNTHNSVPAIITCDPRPACRFTPTFNLGPKTVLKFLREYLREQLGRDRLAIHNSYFSRLLCHAPGLVSAGAFLL